MSDFLSGLLGGRRGGGGGGMGGTLRMAALALLLHQMTKNSRQGGGGGGGGLGGLLGGLFGGSGAAAGQGGMAGDPRTQSSGGGGLGGLLGGLGGLLGGLRGHGLSQEVESWVSTGPNRRVPPQALEPAFDPQELDEAARQAGTDRGAVLNELSRILPDFVDRMTPNGQLPRDESEFRSTAGGSGGDVGSILGSLFGGGAGDAPEAGAGARGGDAARPYGGGGMPRFSEEPPGPAGESDPASGYRGPDRA